MDFSTTSNKATIKQMLHAHGASQRQANIAVNWYIGALAMIERDGTGALTDQLWRSFGSTMVSADVPLALVKEGEALLHTLAERVDAQRRTRAR